MQKIVRRHFAKVDDKWCEVEDLQTRGVTFDRTWSSFCVFFASSEEGRLKELCARTTRARVDVVSCPSLGGLWVMGAYYELEMLLA